MDDDKNHGAVGACGEGRQRAFLCSVVRNRRNVPDSGVGSWINVPFGWMGSSRARARELPNSELGHKEDDEEIQRQKTLL
jgi:hypothetical protein